MPWFPEFVSAIEMARRQTRSSGQAVEHPGVADAAPAQLHNEPYLAVQQRGFVHHRNISRNDWATGTLVKLRWTGVIET